MLWSGPWLPGCLLGGHGPALGPEQLQRTALEAFWPEEVTEKWVGASEGPGDSRKGQMLLILRVNQRTFLQLPLVSQAPKQRAALAAV